MRHDLVVVDAGDFLPDPADLGELDPLTIEETKMYQKLLLNMGYTATVLGNNELSFGGDIVANVLSGPGPEALITNLSYQVAGALRHKRVVSQGRSIVFASMHEPRFYLNRADQEERVLGWDFLDKHSSLSYIDSIARSDEVVVIAGRIRAPLIRELINSTGKIDVILTLGTEGVSKRVVDGQIRDIEEQEDGMIENTAVLMVKTDVYGVFLVDVYVDEESGHVVGAEKSYFGLSDWVPAHVATEKELDDFYSWVGKQERLHGETKSPLLAEWSGEVVEFVGSERCAGCHTPQHVQWTSTQHAKAYKTLLDAHRHYHPKCIACHSVGFSHPTGYKIGMRENALANVGCEMCHGPGGKHVASGSFREIVRTPPERACLACHDSEHDDDFDYVSHIQFVTH